MPNNFSTTNPPVGMKFIIKNINTRKAVTAFGLKLVPGASADLFTIPEIDEDAVKTSLTKGELKQKLEDGEIIITESTLSLPVIDPTYKAFLISKGLPATTVSGSSIATVANLAALQALPNPGAASIVQVQSNLSYYFFDPITVISADGYMVFNPPSGTGVWIRSREGHERWIRQGLWYIDPVNGNDENVGISSGTALKSIRELSFRWGGILARPMVVNLLGNLPTADSLSQLSLVENWNSVNAGGASPSLTINGAKTTVASGTVTAASIEVPASNLASQFSDTTVSDWTPHVGRYVEFSGGAKAWIFKDLGSNTARVTRFSNLTGSAVSAPAPGETYTVSTLTIVPPNFPTVLGHINTTGIITLQNIETNPAGVVPTSLDGDSYTCNGCKFPVLAGGVSGCGITLNNSLVQNIGVTTSFVGSNNSARFNCSGFLGTGLSSFVWQNGSSIQCNHLLVQGCVFSIQDHATGLLTSLGVFDCTSGANAGLLVMQGSYVTLLTSFYGSGNVVATSILRGAQVHINTSLGTPTCTGTGELSFEQSNTHIPVLVAGASVPASSTMITWAQWAASPFSKNVMSFKTGGKITGT